MQPSASDLDMSSAASLFWSSLMRPLGWQRVAEAGILSLCPLSLSLKLYLCPRLCAYSSFLIYSDDPPVSLSLSLSQVCECGPAGKSQEGNCQNARHSQRAPQVKSSGLFLPGFQNFLGCPMLGTVAPSWWRHLWRETEWTETYYGSCVDKRTKKWLKIIDKITRWSRWHGTRRLTVPSDECSSFYK